MAECITCGKSMGFSDKMNAKNFDGNCVNCTKKVRDNKALSEVDVVALEEQELSDLQFETEINSIMLTTETVPNLNIKSRVGIIMADADCSFTVKMVENNNALQSKLRSEAHSIGANAVVGITFNMIETYSATLGVSKVNTFKLIAYGTAVIIEE